MTGFCNDELTGRELSPLLLTGEDLAIAESKKAVRQKGIADSYELAVTTKTGEVKWMLVSGAPLYDDDQRLVGSIGIYLDVTPQKQLEASLREAKGLAEISTRAKQDFLANMSHEIRTPMNAILGMSQLLAKTELSGPQASYLHAITSSAENLLVIINDILDLSKIEAGRITIEKIGFSALQSRRTGPQLRDAPWPRPARRAARRPVPHHPDSAEPGQQFG
jgi:PAS domain S-box-containing protein